MSKHSKKEIEAMVQSVAEQMFQHYMYQVKTTMKDPKHVRYFGALDYGNEHEAAANAAVAAVVHALRDGMQDLTGSLDGLADRVVAAAKEKVTNERFKTFLDKYSAKKSNPKDGIGEKEIFAEFNKELAQDFADSVDKVVRDVKAEARAEQAAKLAERMRPGAELIARLRREKQAKATSEDKVVAVVARASVKRFEAAASKDAPEQARQAVLEAHRVKEEKARAAIVAAETQRKGEAATAVQRVFRGHLGRSKAEDLQEKKVAATKIQRAYHAHATTKKQELLAEKHAAQDAAIDKITYAVEEHFKKHLVPTPKRGWAWVRAVLTFRSRAHEAARDGVAKGMAEIAKKELTKLMRKNPNYDMNDHGKLKRQVIDNLTAQTQVAKDFLDENSRAKTGVRSGISADAAKDMFFNSDTSAFVGAVQSSVQDTEKREAVGKIVGAVRKHQVQQKTRMSASLEAVHEKVTALASHVAPRLGRFRGAYTEQHKGAMEAVDKIVKEETEKLLRETPYKGQKINPAFIKQILGKKLETDAVKSCINSHLQARPISRLRDTGRDESRNSFLGNTKACELIKEAVKEAVQAASKMSHKAKGHWLEAKSKSDARAVAHAKALALKSAGAAARHKKPKGTATAAHHC